MSEKSHRYQPLSGREFPRFSAVKTFFRMPMADLEDDYDVGICGVPFDGAASYRPGSRFGPTTIREISALGRGYHWQRDSNFVEKIKVADIGDCPTVPIDRDSTYQRIEDYFDKLGSLDKKFIAVGGDHSITLPILRSAYRKAGQPLNLVHFDAHLDTYPAAWDCEYHHGAFLRHAVNEGIVDPKRTLQVGIRGPLAGADDLAFPAEHGIVTTTIDDLRTKGMEAYLESLPSFEDGPTYLTFDIDSIDPAFAPGTGTPVPGGLTTYEVQRIMRGLNIGNLVGADIVEVSPPFDSSDITSLAAVDVMFEILSHYAAQSG